MSASNWTPVDALYEFQRAVTEKIAAVAPEHALKHHPNQVFIPGNSTAALRANLVQEEARELANALMLEDKAQVAKEMADLLYVTYAVAVIYDIPVYPVFHRVHSNNMLKVATGTVREDGKLKKAEDHPKVILTDLVK